MNNNNINNVIQGKKSQTYSNHIQQNEDAPISLTPWTKGIRRRPGHKFEQDEEDTRAPLSIKELELEKENRKSGKQYSSSTPKTEKQEWHTRPYPTQNDDSPRSERLERELKNANDALIQLKEQVDQTRKKRLSKSPLQTFNTPKVRGSPNSKQHHHSSKNHLENAKVNHGLGLNFGQEETELHEKIKHARDHARHHEGRPIAVNKHKNINCGQPKRTTFPENVKAKNQWAVFASTASPVMPSSAHSTPQITSTPTFQSSTWTESPIVTSMESFASSFTQSTPRPSTTPFTQPTPRPSTTPFTPFTSSQESNSQQQAKNEDNRVVLASALAGGLTGAVLLALLALWAILSCRRRKKRREELENVLDKVAPPRSSFSDSTQKQSDIEEKNVDMNSHDQSIQRSNISESANSNEPVEVRIVPSLDVPQLYPGASADLEAYQRHSHELAHSGIIAKGVRSDASFTWKFPKLSVPPAAARAIPSGHYVKKRLTMPSERSLQSFSDRSSISPSKPGRTSLDHNKKFVGTGSVSDSTISTSFLFAHHGSTNASSEKIDPQIDHKRKTFVKEQNIPQQPINDEIAMKNSRTGSLPSSIGVHDWFRSEQSTQDILRKQEAIRRSRNSTVILAHDPVMQNVMQNVLSLTEDTDSVESHQSIFPLMPVELGQRIGKEIDQISIFTSAISDDAKEDWKYANSALNGTSFSSMQDITPFRRTSWAGSALDTCREDSQESEQVSRDLRSAPEGNKRNSLLSQDAQQNTKSQSSDQISARYSAHSIIVHSVEDEIIDDWESSNDHSIPISPNLRRPRSSTTLDAPKIMLTSTEEDGKHERQISVTSIETTKTSTSKASSTSSSQDGFFDINSAVIFSDMANAIGQAYEEKIQSSIVKYDNNYDDDDDQKEREKKEHTLIQHRNINRDSESTLDSLVAYSRERQETLIMQTSHDSMDGQPFNETFSRAASRAGFDDSQLVQHQRNSVTPSETGTICLIDDDFPTIPSWKPMQKTAKQTNVRSLDSQERIQSNNYF